MQYNYDYSWKDDKEISLILNSGIENMKELLKNINLESKNLKYGVYDIADLL